jgi:hypothetical protein
MSKLCWCCRTSKYKEKRKENEYIYIFCIFPVLLVDVKRVVRRFTCQKKNNNNNFIATNAGFFSSASFFFGLKHTQTHLVFMRRRRKKQKIAGSYGKENITRAVCTHNTFLHSPTYIWSLFFFFYSFLSLSDGEEFHMHDRRWIGRVSLYVFFLLHREKKLFNKTYVYI